MITVYYEKYPINMVISDNSVLRKISYKYGHFCLFKILELKDVGLVKYFELLMFVYFSIDKKLF